MVGLEAFQGLSFPGLDLAFLKPVRYTNSLETQARRQAREPHPSQEMLYSEGHRADRELPLPTLLDCL